VTERLLSYMTPGFPASLFELVAERLGVDLEFDSARSGPLDELAGHRIGCNDPISLSGHHALRFEIERRGGDPDAFADLVFTGGHDASLDAVAAGELDAAVIDSVVRTRRIRTDPTIASLRAFVIGERQRKFAVAHAG